MTVVSDTPEPVIDYEHIKASYEKHLAEIDWIYVSAMKRGDFRALLEPFSEEHKKCVAVMLENQRLMNEAGRFKNDEWFVGCSYELIAKIFTGFVGFDMVNVQPMYGPNAANYGYRFKYEAQTDSDLPNVHLKLVSEDISAKTKKLKAMPLDTDEDYVNQLDAKAEEIRNEITREIATDLRNNAGTVAASKVNFETMTYENMFIKIVEVSGVLHRKTLRGGTDWLMMGVDLAKKIPPYSFAEGVDLDKLTGPTKIGVLNNRWKCIVDPLFPKGQMLVGAHDPKGLYGSYFWCPYVMLAPTPVILDMDFCPRRGLLMRYGKRLYREGAKFFARINFQQDDDRKPSEYVI